MNLDYRILQSPSRRYYKIQVFKETWLSRFKRLFSYKYNPQYIWKDIGNGTFFTSLEEAQQRVNDYLASDLDKNENWIIYK